VDERSLHNDGNTSRLDGLLDGDGDLLGEPLLDLEPTREGLGYSGELGDAEDELVRDVADVDLRSYRGHK
jgi:hypothetical protein